jgi:hypothetical protein
MMFDLDLQLEMADDIIKSLHSSTHHLALQTRNTDQTIQLGTTTTMPKTPTKPAAVKRESTLPYPSSSSPSPNDDSDSKDEVSPKNVKGEGTGSSKSVWTAAEQKQLFQFAINRKGRGWGEAVPGKTAAQARCLWS